MSKYHMSKLIVTADVHGSFSSWQAIKALMKSQDKLAIAGDLFDTKHGNCFNSDFKPDAIKDELKRLNRKFYYVYGNCDTPSFFPGFEVSMQLSIFKKQILLYHGHESLKYPSNVDIIITGHTHRYALEQKSGQIFMNPGSIARPKNGVPSYGVIDGNKNIAKIIEFETGRTLSSIQL